MQAPSSLRGRSSNRCGGWLVNFPSLVANLDKSNSGNQRVARLPCGSGVRPALPVPGRQRECEFSRTKFQGSLSHTLFLSLRETADLQHFDVCGAEEIAGDGASPEQSSRRVW